MPHYLEMMPFMQNIVVTATFLDFFKPIYFPCCQSQGAVTFLYRGFGQDGSNRVLLFDLIIALRVIGLFIFYNGAWLSFTRLLATAADSMPIYSSQSTASFLYGVLDKAVLTVYFLFYSDSIFSSYWLILFLKIEPDRLLLDS